MEPGSASVKKRGAGGSLRREARKVLDRADLRDFKVTKRKMRTGSSGLERLQRKGKKLRGGADLGCFEAAFRLELHDKALRLLPFLDPGFECQFRLSARVETRTYSECWIVIFGLVARIFGHEPPFYGRS